MYGIAGQDKILNGFRKSAENGRLSHAYLITGDRGLGKKLIAREFAATILCKNPDSREKPCGVCSSCHKLLSGNHPDVHIFRPEKKEYTVDQLDSIQDIMRRRPNESEKSIFIFEEGDSLSVSFQNKFLKILEEPPESVIIIIIADNAEKLLETTLSRVRTVKINPVPSEVCRNYIEEKYGKNEETAFAAEFANGNIGRAVELISDGEFRELREKTVRIAELVSAGDRIKLIESLDFFEDNKDSSGEILNILSIWFRDILIYLKTSCKDYIINTDKYDIIKEEGKKLSSDQIYEIMGKIEDTKWRLNQNANYTSTMTNFLIEISNI